MTRLLEVEDWPRAGDPDRARLGLERWAEQAALCDDPALEAFADRLIAEPGGRRLLEGVFGNSPFLTECLLREIAFLKEMADHGVDAAFRAVLERARAELADEPDPARLMRGLRLARRQVALVTALADIGGLWPLDRVTGALSGFADAAVELALRQVLRGAHEAGAIDLPDPATPTAGSGVFVLGMGKLGAKELNYSSDIDLIVLYDDGRLRTRRPDTLNRALVRATRQLARILDERTADGYVFRTDLRLRPDPGATPLAVSVTAAETYYGSMALNWERAAMIKARVIAGDNAAGAAFLRFLEPFVWRRTLDFYAIRDIHAIKRQINAHRGSATIGIQGHDVKVGRGGIREIELYAQTQQLIFGGREPRLRTPGTTAALRGLAEAGRIEAAAADDLILAYTFLRTVEHRLQMVDDQQTQALPRSEAGIDAISSFLGFATPDMFQRRLRRTLERVDERYSALFQEETPVPDGTELVFMGADDDPATLDALGALGYENPVGVATTVRGWLHGRYRATRSERARALLEQLLPALLNALAQTPHPDSALFHFDEFLARLPAGVQLFALFSANPDLLDLVAGILGISPRLAGYLAANPILIESVLTPGFFERPPPAETLQAELDEQLARAADYQDVLEIVRRWTNDQRFRAGVQVLRHICRGTECGPFLSDVADAGLAALRPRVEAEFARRHGGFGGSRWALIAMGKLGGREMSVRSDLDLVIVYDTTDAPPESDGAKPLAPGVYFTRLTQRLISAITAPTREGALYEVDMRLRPSGTAGPIAVGLEAFRRYHAESAWTWEHLALTRARVIAGPPTLRREIEATFRAVLTRPREPVSLLRDVAGMRRRIDQEHGTDDPWRVKYARGGLLDIEFLAQYLQLREAASRPGVLHPNTEQALKRLGEAGVLDADTAGVLIEARRLWEDVQAYLRLTHEGRVEPETVPLALRTGLSRIVLGTDAGAADFEAATARMRQVAERSFACYRRVVDAPAEALPPADA